MELGKEEKIIIALGKRMLDTIEHCDKGDFIEIAKFIFSEEDDVEWSMIKQLETLTNGSKC